MADDMPGGGGTADSLPEAEFGSSAGGATGPHPAEAAIESVTRAAEALQSATGGSAPAAPGGSAPATPGDPGAAKPLALPDFGAGADRDGSGTGLSLLSDVALQVKVELGRTRMLVEDVLRLTSDSVIELDNAAGDPVDIFVNNRHVARGEVLVLNDNFCVRVSEIIQGPPVER